MQAVNVKPGVIKRIHVNQHNIRKFKKEGASPPVLTVKTGKKNLKGDKVEIVRDGEVLAILEFKPDKPLNCGATVWIETKEEVRVTQHEQHNLHTGDGLRPPPRGKGLHVCKFLGTCESSTK